MAKQKEMTCNCGCMHHHSKMWIFGFGLFLLGFMRYLGYSWNVVFMVLGALAFLKGLIIKMKYK